MASPAMPPAKTAIPSRIEEISMAELLESDDTPLAGKDSDDPISYQRGYAFQLSREIETMLDLIATSDDDSPRLTTDTLLAEIAVGALVRLSRRITPERAEEVTVKIREIWREREPEIKLAKHINMCLHIGSTGQGVAMTKDEVLQQIKEDVSVLPREERLAVQIQALVESVPAESTYQEQIKDFTAITHSMRVRMTRQLEPRFREHLLQKSPSADDCTQQDNGLAERKITFANKITDELYRLGLVMKWDQNPDAHYLKVFPSQSHGRYRLVNQVTHGENPPDITDWRHGINRKARREMTEDEVLERLNKVGLMDAAAPNTPNVLSPRIQRKSL